MTQRFGNGQLSPNELPADDRIVKLLLADATEEDQALFVEDLSATEKRELAADLEALANLSVEVARNMPAPRKALKERILAAAAADQPSDAHIVREVEETWVIDPNLPGIRMKILHQDATTGVMTALAQLDPGTTYPAHRHVGPETCYVISGDLHVNSTDLGAGDFIANPDGAVHHRTYTVGGCFLLLASSFKDQFFHTEEPAA